jgi:hypothetical protein
LDATEDLQCCSTYPLYAQVLSNFAKPPAEAAATTTTKEGNNKGTAYIITDTSIGFFSSKHRAVQTPNSKPWFDAPESNEEEVTQNNKKEKNENKTQTTITTTTTIMSKR